MPANCESECPNIELRRGGLVSKAETKMTSDYRAIARRQLACAMVAMSCLHDEGCTVDHTGPAGYCCVTSAFGMFYKHAPGITHLRLNVLGFQASRCCEIRRNQLASPLQLQAINGTPRETDRGVYCSQGSNSNGIVFCILCECAERDGAKADPANTEALPHSGRNAYGFSRQGNYRLRLRL